MWFINMYMIYNHSLFVAANTIIEKLRLSGSLAMNWRIIPDPFAKNYSGEHAPWFTGHFLNPSNS